MLAETQYEIKKLHPEYSANVARWQMISDCLGGEETIKSKKETYLPFPIPDPDGVLKQDAEFIAKYNVYLEGAHFTNYTEQAVEDLVSGCFRKDVIVNCKGDSFDYLLVDDAARNIVWNTTAFGRCFAITEYPVVEEGAKRKDDEKNAAYIVVHSALSVINWESKVIGGRDTQTRVVVVQYGEKESDSVYIEYLIDVDGIYKIRIHSEIDGKLQYKEFVPKANGKTLSNIPGTFIGSISNSATVDRAPVYGIARSNIKHYQTWAELIHVQTYAGHPQIALTGLPNGWLRMSQSNQQDCPAGGASSGNGGGAQSSVASNIQLQIGASRVIALEGEASKIERLDGASDTVIHFKTLEQLEKSMLEQGARIKSFDAKGGVESAQGMMIRHAGESSQLAKIATNTERGLTLLLKYDKISLHNLFSISLRCSIIKAHPILSFSTVIIFSLD